MARIPPRLPASPPVPSGGTTPATWANWFWKFQAFQVHAVRDALATCNRCVAALALARDAQSIGAACVSGLGDWVACAEGIQNEWFVLSAAVPGDALAALGWRLKRSARSGDDRELQDGSPDLFEQSRLGAEMLLRPWLPASGLDHTDEFVA